MSYYIYAPIRKKELDFQEPTYSDFFSAYATKEKVFFGLRDICVALQTYLLPCIQGDFSWTDKIEELRLNKEEDLI